MKPIFYENSYLSKNDNALRYVNKCLNIILPSMNQSLLDAKISIDISEVLDNVANKVLLKALKIRLLKAVGIEVRNIKAIIIANAAYGCKQSLKVAVELLENMSDKDFYDVMAVNYSFNGRKSTTLWSILVGGISFYEVGVRLTLACKLLSSGATESRLLNVPVSSVMDERQTEFWNPIYILSIMFRSSSFENYATQNNCVEVFRPLLELYEDIAKKFFESGDGRRERCGTSLINRYVHDACSRDEKLCAYVYDSLTAENDLNIKIRKLLRSTSIKQQSLNVLNDLRERKWLRFDKVKEDKGFTFPTKKQCRPDVLNQIGRWIIEDHLDESGELDFDLLLESISHMPKSASIIMPFMIQEIGEDEFWIRVKKVGVVSKLLEGTNIDVHSAMSKSSISVKTWLMYKILL